MTIPLDKKVEALGGYDKLSDWEKETYEEQLKVIEAEPVTIESTRKFVRNMITMLEKMLVDTTENSNESRNLKARLKNFLVLEQYLYSYEKAKEALERYNKK